MPTTIRNNQPGPTVFTDRQNNVAIEWEGKGDPRGLDVQQVPDDLLRNVNFMRAVQRGIFTVEEASADIQALLDRQVEAAKADRERASTEARAALAPEADNDLVTTPCIGPSPRGEGACGEQVLVRSKRTEDHPPLCANHEALASQYVLTHTDRLVDGKPEVQWVRASMARRQQQSEPIPVPGGEPTTTPDQG